MISMIWRMTYIKWNQEVEQMLECVLWADILIYLNDLCLVRLLTCKYLARLPSGMKRFFPVYVIQHILSHCRSSNSTSKSDAWLYSRFWFELSIYTAYISIICKTRYTTRFFEISDTIRAQILFLVIQVMPLTLKCAWGQNCDLHSYCKITGVGINFNNFNTHHREL